MDFIFAPENMDFCHSTFCLHIKNMKPKETIREYLQPILDKELAACTENDIAILRARRFYITSDEAERYELDKSDKVEPAEKVGFVIKITKQIIRLSLFIIEIAKFAIEVIRLLGLVK